MDTPEGYEKRKLLNERMRKAIPNTYTYHFCAYDTMNDSVSQAHIERAYQLMPANRTFGEEYGTFIAYFWQKGRDKELKEMGRKYYEEQQIPTALLRYNYNELQCLPPQRPVYRIGRCHFAAQNCFTARLGRTSRQSGDLCLVPLLARVLSVRLPRVRH